LGNLPNRTLQLIEAHRSIRQVGND
jgi:hypothetical protein